MHRDFKSEIENTDSVAGSEGKAGLSNRGTHWLNFSSKVLHHIETYTVPQYGDHPVDYITDWSPEDCVQAIGKYCARFKSNSRKGQEALDMLKIAHFAQMAHRKLGE